MGVTDIEISQVKRDQARFKELVDIKDTLRTTLAELEVVKAKLEWQTLNTRIELRKLEESVINRVNRAGVL